MRLGSYQAASSSLLVHKLPGIVDGTTLRCDSKIFLTDKLLAWNRIVGFLEKLTVVAGLLIIVRIGVILFAQLHLWSDRLVIIIKILIKRRLFTSTIRRPILRAPHLGSFEPGLSHLLHTSHAHLVPILLSLLEIFHSLFKNILFVHKFLDLSHWVFARIFLHHLKSFPQIFVLLWQLKHLSIPVIELLGLSLDRLPEWQVTLKYFFHHIDRVNDSLGDGVFRFICCTMWLMRILLPLVTCDIFQLVSLLLKEFVHFFLILNNSLRNNLPVLYNGAIARLSGGFSGCITLLCRFIASSTTLLG